MNPTLVDREFLDDLYGEIKETEQENEDLKRAVREYRELTIGLNKKVATLEERILELCDKLQDG